MTTLTPNAQRLLRALVTEGPAYRADLARTLDLSRATITNLVNRLHADGWVEEPDHSASALKNLIGTAPRLGVLASIVFLVDSCTVTLTRLDGRVLSEYTLPGLSAMSASSRLEAGGDLVDRMLEEHGLTAGLVRAVHLAVDTQMDAATGEISAQRASSRWYGVNPKQYVHERFGAPVHLENSVRLEGLAEYLWGAGAGTGSMLYLDVSLGVTSSLVSEGRILSGARGGSGELGHAVYDWNGPLCTCGNAGCLMQYVSVPALLRDYETAAGTALRWAELCALTEEGDPTATAVLTRAAQVLGRVLVSTCHLLDPGVVVLGGAVPRALPSFVGDVAAVVRESALPLVARHLSVLAATPTDRHEASARAGIASLRALEDVVSAATTI